MMENRRTIKIFFLVMAALSSVGCFGVRQLDVMEGYEGFKNLHPDMAAVEQAGGTEAITLDLIVPETAGCVPLMLHDGEEKEQRGHFRCMVFAVTTGEEKDGLKRKYKSMGKDEGDPQKMGFSMMQYGATLQTVLEKQLGSHFGEVSINRVDALSGSSAIVNQESTFYYKFWRSDEKTMVLTLTATPAGGGLPVSVSQEVTSEMGNGHLAWMIPLGVLTFPIGYAIGLGVFSNMETDLIERVIGEAMDKAAGALAARLAGQVAVNSDNHYRVHLSVSYL
jgi:hypothetical protein